jgi:hypothetical protein
MILLVAALALVDDLDIAHVPRPQAARQIPRSVFDRRATRAAGSFGFEMGTGVRTYVTAAAPYIAAAGLLLVAGGWGDALIVGAAFGLARGWLPVSRSLALDANLWDVDNARIARWGAVPGIAVVTVATLYGRGLL